jgi:hypothetical protein
LICSPKYGTLLPGDNFAMTGQIKFNRISSDYKTIMLAVQITDVYNTKWILDVPVTLYGDSTDVNVVTNSSAFEGFLILPGHKLYQIFNPATWASTADGFYYNTNSMPKLINSHPLFVFSQAVPVASDVIYSIGIGVPAVLDTLNVSTSSYEPNNTEATAAVIKYGTLVKSYLHFEDIDFYQIVP